MTAIVQTVEKFLPETKNDNTKDLSTLSIDFITIFGHMTHSIRIQSEQIKPTLKWEYASYLFTGYSKQPLSIW